MKTISVHAHLLALAEGEGAPAPGHWCHDLSDGSLSCRFGSSPTSHTWDAAAIDAFGTALDAEPRSAAARELLARWAAIRELLDRGDLDEPDRVYVAHDTDEITLVWEASKTAVTLAP